MALNFPDSPIEGETYNGYVYDATNSLWKVNYPTSETISVPDGIVSGVSGASVTTTTVGDDTVYSFLDDGTITVETAGYFDVLLVGGGGSGGMVAGGGGGAGAHLYIENAYLPAGSLDVVVGAGGTAKPKLGNDGRVGQNGLPSSLWKYFAPGGGAGGSFSRSDSPLRQNAFAAINGGSGGGSGGWGHNGPPAVALGISGLGNNGGVATSANYFAGAGGGGAGAVGSDTDATNNGGNGGDGIANSITGSSVIRAGGGGGAARTASDTPGAGGSGGGGAGASTGSGTDGAANTGSGGGGGRENASTSSGAGGSGIVIVRERGSSGS